MNPNNSQIQIVWAWAQACLGDAERGLPATELALRLNPCHPRYYEHYRSRVLFLARRHAEALAVLERITAEDPLDHPRDLAWRAGACGHLGRADEARQSAGLFPGRSVPLGGAIRRQALRITWNGWWTRPTCGAWRTRRTFREGLRIAGLPA